MHALLLKDYYTSTFEPLYLRSRAQQTKKLYKTSIKTFRTFLTTEPTLDDLNDETVTRFLGWFRSLPRAAATVNKERSNLLAIWRHACRRNIKTNWPSVERENEPHIIPQAWSEDELNHLIRTCRNLKGYIGRIPAAKWWTALHLTCWDTGERIGAIRDIEWKHLKDGWLLIPAELRKGKRKDRLYKLTDESLTALRDISTPRRPKMFPWPYSYTYLWHKYTKLLKTAELPTDRKSKFHRIRRSVASHATAAGADATKLLGHSKTQTTEAYIDPRIVQEPQAIDFLFRLTQPETP